MQKVDANALVPGSVYQIVHKDKIPEGEYVFAKGTFSENHPRLAGFADFKNITFRDGGRLGVSSFKKEIWDFYPVEQQPEPPSRGGRSKRRTRRNAKKSKKHVGRRRRGLSRKH